MQSTARRAKIGPGLLTPLRLVLDVNSVKNGVLIESIFYNIMTVFQSNECDHGFCSIKGDVA